MRGKAENSVLFGITGCLTQEAISLFVGNKLTVSENKQIKGHIVDCELCSNAVEGAKEIKSLSSFNLRIDQMHSSPWRKSMGYENVRSKLYYGVSSVAASLVILLGVYIILRFDKIATQEIVATAGKEVLNIEKISDSNKTNTLGEGLTGINPGKDLLKEGNKTVEGNIGLQSFDLTEMGSVITEKENFSHDPLYSELELCEDVVFEQISNEKDKLNEIVSNLGRKEQLGSSPSNIAENGSEPLERRNKGESVLSSSKEKGVFTRKIKDRRGNGESYVMAEVSPMFQGGGIEEFNRFLTDSLKVIIPDSALVESLILSFIVDTAGNIRKVKLISGTSSNELNNIIIDYVKSTPVWIPAYFAGEPVETNQQLEIVLDTKN